MAALGKTVYADDTLKRLISEKIRDEGLDHVRLIADKLKSAKGLHPKAGKKSSMVSLLRMLTNYEGQLTKLLNDDYAEAFEVPISAAELRQQSKERARTHEFDRKQAGILGITVEEYRNSRVAREAQRKKEGKPLVPPVLDDEPTPEFLKVFDKARLLFSTKTTRSGSFAVWQRLTEDQRNLAERALPHLRQEVLDSCQNDETRLLEARKFNPKTFEVWLADAGWEDYRTQLESGAAPVSNYKSPEKRAREARRAVLWAGVDVGGAPDHILKLEAESMAKHAYLYPGHEPAEEPDDLSIEEAFQ